LTSLYSYLLFHSLAEIFSIVIACGIFMIAWNSRRFLDDHYLLFVGIAYLFIGGMDLIHTLAYKGMGIFPGYDANLPTQFWITARYVESLSLLIAPLFLGKKLNHRFVFVGYAAVVGLLAATIFGRLFPDCYVEGVGLTPFKTISEYIICLFLLASAFLLLQKRGKLGRNVLRWLLISIVATIGSELAFTLYIGVYDAANLVGHFFKIVSFYLVYKAIIETGLMRPYDLLFRNLKQSEEVLRAEKEFSENVLNSLVDTVFIFDPITGNPLRWNRAFAEISGYADEEIASKKAPDDWYGEKDLKRVRTATERVFRDGRAAVVEMSLITMDGSLIPTEYTGSLIRDAEGNPQYLIAVGRDVTARKRAEEALRRRMEELAVLHAIAVAGAEATGLGTLIERATEIIGGILSPDNFGVGLVDETAGVLRIHPSYRGLREELRGLTLSLDQGVVGQVVTTGQPCRVSNVTREAACLDLNAGMRSELCVPLRVGARVIGVINAESRHPDAFSEDDQRLLMTFAGQLATAIEKVRLFEAERRRAQEAETLRQAGAVVAATLQQEEAIERILQELAHVVSYDSAAVQLLREGYVETVGGRGWPDPSIVIGLHFPVPGDNPNTVVIQQRRPHILADAPAAYASFREEPHTRVRSWLGVPLIVRGQVIGMLAVDGEQPDYFTPDHARLVTAFADQVAIAIENARLFKEVQQLAITDPLTGIYNRRHFFELAEREFDRARRYQRPLSALMLDVDHFKQVNDTHGHAAGDQVLYVAAECCQESLRKTDVLGRYGGDELAVLFPETDLANARLIAERLRQRIAQTAIDIKQTPVAITASLGVGALDEECTDLDALLRRADRALYAAKQAGRNCVRVWRS
jgi:diguanylate cyclase (GGDEF)-like protein/PAS domain S-box-containing protein